MEKTKPVKKWRSKEEYQREFTRLYESLTTRHARWEVWADFITLVAIEISNAVDKDHAAERGKMYQTIAGRYTAEEKQVMVAMLAQIEMGMEQDQDQDFLGELFMALSLGNDHNGQFFTPYCVCQAMSEITANDDLIEQQIEDNGWIACSDPACGAGALLVAFANHCKRKNIYYHDRVLFVAQDIDFITGLMCYIQMSFLGCPGYVVIGDTLAHPVTSVDKRGLIPVDEGNIWYTPFYFAAIWQGRIMCACMDMALERTSKPPDESKTDEKPAEVEQKTENTKKNHANAKKKPASAKESTRKKTEPEHQIFDGEGQMKLF